MTKDKYKYIEGLLRNYKKNTTEYLSEVPKMLEG